MLTHNQLMWFHGGERDSLTRWYAEGQRNRPWSRIVLFDSMKYQKMAEATGQDLESGVHRVTTFLRGGFEADTVFLTFVGVTLLPHDKSEEWRSQQQVNDLMLQGAPEAKDIGKALFTVATEGEGHLYVVAQRFDEEGRTVNWNKTMFTTLSSKTAENDPMMTELHEATRTMRTFFSEHGIGVGLMPRDMEDAARAAATTTKLCAEGFEVRIRMNPNLSIIRPDLEAAGVQFYGGGNA